MSVKNTLCTLLTDTEKILGLKVPNVTVLAYHAVSEDKTIVDITPRTFKEQLAFLASRFQFVTLDDVCAYVNGKRSFSKPAVSFTFDDGYIDVFTTVYPLLQKYAVPGCVFVLSDPQNADRGELGNAKQLLSYSQLRQLHKNGWIIGCHSSTHADFTKPGLSVDEEIGIPRSKLTQELGFPVAYFAYPKGDYTGEIVEAVQHAGYSAAFTFESGFISQRTNRFLIPRMPVDATHTPEQFAAFFTNWGKAYLHLRYGMEKRMRAH